MTTLRRLFRNTSVLIVANAIQPLLSFYLIVTISRKLELEGFGAYSTVFNYQAIFQIFAAFGLRNLLVRNVAQYPDQIWRYLWHGSLIVVPFSLLSVLVLIGLTAALNYGEMVFIATAAVSLSLFATSLVEVCEGAIAGVERLHIIGYSAVVENFIRVAASLVLLEMGFGLLALVWVFVVTKFIKAALYYWYVHRYVAAFTIGDAGPRHFSIDWDFARSLISQARVFALTMICVTIYWKIDVSLLSKLRGLEEVGLYTAAYRFLTLALVVVDSFVNSLFPVISNYYRASAAAGAGNSQFELACKKGLQFLLVLVFPLAMSLSLLAEPITTLIYGSKYAASIPLLRVVSWVVVPYAASQIFAYALVASNHQRYDLIVNAISMVASVILNWILIDRYGEIGAAIAVLIAIFIYVGLQVPIIFSKVFRIRHQRLWRGGLKLMVAGGAMAASLVMFSQIEIWFLLPMAFLIYVLALIVVRIFSRRDWLLASRFLR